MKNGLRGITHYPTHFNFELCLVSVIAISLISVGLSNKLTLFIDFKLFKCNSAEKIKIGIKDNREEKKSLNMLPRIYSDIC